MHHLDKKSIIFYRNITQVNIKKICYDLDKAINEIKKSKKLNDVLIRGLSLIKDLQLEIFSDHKNLSIRYDETINWTSNYLSYYKPIEYFGEAFKFLLRHLTKDAIFFKFDFAQIQQLSKIIKSNEKDIDSF